MSDRGNDKISCRRPTAARWAAGQQNIEADDQQQDDCRLVPEAGWLVVNFAYCAWCKSPFILVFLYAIK
jgi:hypothetical protein